MSESRLDVLSLCETWHEDSECITIGRLRELGYNVIEQARPIAPDAKCDSVDYINYGGVALLSTSAFQLTTIAIAGEFKTFEFVCGRLMSRETPAIILTVYRPGSSPITAAFFKELETMFERLVLMSGVIVIAGDFNIRLDRPTEPHSVKFIDLLAAYEFEQLVVQPTHQMSGILGHYEGRVCKRIASCTRCRTL